MDKITTKPDYIFEVSWEVCNKLGGIYTVISTKAIQLSREFGDNYILIGPDVWKETKQHPEFIESANLFSQWRESAKNKGLHFRIGRWEIPGKPIVILVDFTPFFTQKNDIFSWMWETYRVDSLSGQWDYIEPALFGYAAAQVIESFYDFYSSAQDKLIAHFHEWMTGSGVLYTKEKVPQAGTLFTTHATTLGRSISGNGMELYKNIENLNVPLLEKNLGIVSKCSLEKIAAREADCFTTVSEATAKECGYFLGKEPDVVTINGFDDSFVPTGEEYKGKRSVAREKLFQVAEGLLGRRISRKALMVITSGRYEFRNKGIDLFIDALGKLNRGEISGPEIIAFITVPAHNTGVNQELLRVMKEGRKGADKPQEKFLTHLLNDRYNDPILRRAAEQELINSEADKVSLIFVPAYLNGSDGIFDLNYYDLLSGFDVSVFPSYYEPWGYTPLESAAFCIPTITTSLAGFGQWVAGKFPEEHEGVFVVPRTEDNEEEVRDNIASFIKEFSSLTAAKKNKVRNRAFEISRHALWEELIVNYNKAFGIAIEKTTERSDLFYNKKKSTEYFLKDISSEHKPVWKNIFIEPAISGKLEKLQELSRNIWWCWNYRAENLFKMADPGKWEELNHNPVALLESLSIDRIHSLEKDQGFLQELNFVYDQFSAYMAEKKKQPKEKVAYFSMEYGLHDTLKTYSGGLGMLAGDFLKEASDSNKNMVAVGLVYRYGYFNQQITIFGDQVATYTAQKFTQLPFIPVRDENGDWVTVSLALPGRNLYAKAWKVEVGRISLYMLDADIPENSPADRSITHHLYGGNWENRFKQELLLGVGGIRLLKALGIEADVYHCNEGHAAFTGLERLRILVQEARLTFDQALETVRASSLFTTHTPVPAGHDYFHEDIMRTYIPHYADRLNISWDRFMSLGKMHPGNPEEKFSMSVLALKLSQFVNGVSKIHGRVTREMFRDLFPGFYPQELFIDYVTNGVHYPFWAGREWQKLYIKYFGEDFLARQSDASFWQKIKEVPDEEIWEMRKVYRSKLVRYLRKRLESELTKREENPRLVFDTIDGLDENAFTIGFARRFATYKRAHLLLSNLERLKNLVTNPDLPIQFIFAGKAHPADKAGQDLIKRIMEISKQEPFKGKIVFVENYDISLAKKLLQGVDVWLNTPTRPMEASGTSGEKALMNGVLNVSVLDGWWAEGYIPHGGWAIKEARTYANQQFQDELDAETIYSLLEDEILPAFYERENEVPEKWIGYIKNSIAGIAPHFTMKRMLDQYYDKFYNTLAERSTSVRMNNYAIAKEVDKWKKKIYSKWEGIKVTRLAVPDQLAKSLHLGDDFVAEIDLDLNGLEAGEIAMDIVVGQKEDDSVKKIILKQDLELVKQNNSSATFRCVIPTSRVGMFDYAFRIFPKHDWLPHRQDMNLVRWI